MIISNVIICIIINVIIKCIINVISSWKTETFNICYENDEKFPHYLIDDADPTNDIRIQFFCKGSSSHWIFYESNNLMIRQ